MEAKFLNVDVDVDLPSEAKLEKLLNELGNKVVILHKGPSSKLCGHTASFEIAEDCTNADETVSALSKVLEQLSPAAAAIWEEALKIFDFGYDLNAAKTAFSFSLSPETLALLNRLAVELKITCYTYGE